MTIYSENRRARFDYAILETFEAGLVLTGQEVKSVRKGQMDLSASHAIFQKGELWLLNATIPPYQPMNTPTDYEPDRKRKLLLNKVELRRFTTLLKEKGQHLIALRVYDKKGLIKLELGLAKKKKKSDQREDLKKRATMREIRGA
ncbi:MAG: SsrA-binding protein SmpB [Patescibacteria group bacterium]